MPKYHNFIVHSRHKVTYFFLGVISCTTLFHSVIASAQTAGYAPAARSATSGNTMLDNVVGNRHSPVKAQTAENGVVYHIAEDGTVTAPNGLIVNAGCPGKGGGPVPQIHSKYRFGIGRRGKGFETILIGVSSEPARATPSEAAISNKKVRRATLNASFGPSNVYVLPRPCAHDVITDKVLTDDAAAALAAADGNAFALAGNRDDVKDVDSAKTFLSGDIELLSTPTIGPALGRISP